MKFQIALAADGYVKGDRVVVKAGKDEWYVGTIATSGVKLKIAFDDGASAMVDASDFKDVKHVDPKTKKLKKALNTIDAKALYTAGKPTKTLKAAKEKVAKIKAAPTATTKVKAPAKIALPPVKSTKAAQVIPKAPVMAKGKSLEATFDVYGTPTKIKNGKLLENFSDGHISAIKHACYENGSNWNTAGAKEFQEAIHVSLYKYEVTKFSDSSYTKKLMEMLKLLELSVKKYIGVKAVIDGDTVVPAIHERAKYPNEGWVFKLNGGRISNPGDEFIVTTVEVGRVLQTVHMYKLNDRKSSTGLYTWKLRGTTLPFEYIRRATQAEIDLSQGKKKALDDHYQKRTDTNLEAQKTLNIQPGDTVLVGYTNGAKNELVTEVNWKTGKVAIYSAGRLLMNRKRRFIHIKNIRSITTKGPGYYK